MSLQIPGQVKINVEHIRGTMAYPHAVTGQEATGIKVLTIGGLTKLEHAACLIAANLASLYIARELTRESFSERPEDFDPLRELSSNAVAIAETVLATVQQREADLKSAAK